MSPSLAPLLASLDRLELADARQGHGAVYGTCLRLLLDASDEDAGAALLARDWLREVIVSRPLTSHPLLVQARLRRWLLHTLRQILAVSGLPEGVNELIDSLGSPTSDDEVALLGLAMRRRTLRDRATRQLSFSRLPEAQALLRANDSSAVPWSIRLDAALHDPARPRPGLVALLGPGSPRDDRESAARHLIYRSSSVGGAALEPDELDLILGCFEDGLTAAAVLHTLASHPDRGVRGRIFARLWPIAQSQRAWPWDGVDNPLFYRALVQSAPAPDLIAALLDEITSEHSASALLDAILERPDPLLVPALLRWSKTHPGAAERDRVTPPLRACKLATPWST